MLLNTLKNFIWNNFATDRPLAMDTHINYCKLPEWILYCIDTVNNYIGCPVVS